MTQTSIILSDSKDGEGVVEGEEGGRGCVCEEGDGCVSSWLISLAQSDQRRRSFSFATPLSFSCKAFDPFPVKHGTIKIKHMILEMIDQVVHLGR